MAATKAELILHRIRSQLAGSILRKPTLEIPVRSIPKNAELQQTIREMRDFVEDPANDLVGLAAPQFRKDWRMFILSHRLFEVPESSFDMKSPNGKTVSWDNTHIPERDDPRLVVINPSVTKAIGPITSHWEECISIPKYQGVVPRFTSLEVEYYAGNGELVTGRINHSAARAFQHELDHLHGRCSSGKASSPSFPDSVSSAEIHHLLCSLLPLVPLFSGILYPDRLATPADLLLAETDSKV